MIKWGPEEPLTIPESGQYFNRLPPSCPRAFNGTVACVMGSLVLQECLVPEEFLKLTGVK